MNARSGAVIKSSDGPGNVKYVQRSTPAPGSGEVLLRLVYAGICHTDLNMIGGEFTSTSGYSPEFPLVLGHEFTAEVEALGKGVDDLRIGEKVISGCHIVCGICTWCQQNRSMLCVERKIIGLDVDGCWAEYFVMPRKNLVVVPESIPDERAAIAEPFTVGAHAIDLSRLAGNERVAIIGPGAVGLLTLGALQDFDVTMIGRRADERQMATALNLGAKRTVVDEDPALDDLRFDVIFETAGAATATELGTRLLAPGGRLVCVGLPTSASMISSAELAWNEQQIIGSRAYDSSTWASVPRRLENAVGSEQIVSHIVNLDEWEHAVELVRSRKALKVLLRPPQETPA